MSEKTRLKKGEAKIQFIACGDRIAELRASGLDIKATYLQLVKENLITMTYTGFYENVSQRQKKRSRKGLAEAAALQSAVLPLPAITSAATAAVAPSPPRPLPQNLTAGPVKSPLPAPQQRLSGLTTSNQGERRKAMQASLENAIKEQDRHLNDSGNDPEMEELKKTLV